MGVSDDFKEEFYSTMIHENMNIYHPIVYSQQLEEARAKWKSRESKRERYFDSGSSKGRLDILEKPRFNKRFSNKFT